MPDLHQSNDRPCPRPAPWFSPGEMRRDCRRRRRRCPAGAAGDRRGQTRVPGTPIAAMAKRSFPVGLDLELYNQDLDGSRVFRVKAIELSRSQRCPERAFQCRRQPGSDRRSRRSACPRVAHRSRSKQLATAQQWRRRPHFMAARTSSCRRRRRHQAGGRLPRCSCATTVSSCCAGTPHPTPGAGPGMALQSKPNSTIQASKKAAEKKRKQAVRNFNNFACYRVQAGQDILRKVGESEVVRLMMVWNYDTGAHFPGHCSGSKQIINGGTTAVLNTIQTSFDNHVEKHNL